MNQGVQGHDEEPSETEDLSSWELTVSGPTAREPTWDQPRLSACVVIVVQHGLFVGLPAVRSEPVPDTSTGFWEPTSHAGLSHPALMQGRSLVLAQLGVPCFVETHGRPAPF